jgi:hypothetical protein
MEALKNSITLRVSVPVLSVSTVLTMPSSCGGRPRRARRAAKMEEGAVGKQAWSCWVAEAGRRGHRLPKEKVGPPRPRPAPRTSLRLEVRATAGVSVSAWYIARSRPMKTKACTILTISMDTYRLMGMR